MDRGPLVWLFLVAACGGGVAACGGGGDGGPDAPPAADASPGYPPGPYGTGVGDVIQDLQWTGLVDGDDAGLLVADDATRLFRLGEIHADPEARILVLIAAAEWCEPCGLEAAELPQVATEFAPRGARIVEAMTQTMTTDPADEPTVRAWATTYSLTTPVMIDPTRQVERYWDALNGYPMTAVIDARTMEILQIVTAYTTAQTRQLLQFYLP